MTAVGSGEGRFTLFVTDPGGGIYTNAGNGWDGWDGWSSVPQGRAAPGSPVTAVEVSGGRFALFATDPTGRIRTSSGNATAGWTPWVSVSDGRAAPGTPVTALFQAGPRRFALFATGPTGRIRTSSGNATDGWAPWASVADGQAAPGTPVTAAVSRGVYGLFVVDPGGGIYTITSGSAEGGWGGWSSVSQGRTAPSAPVTAVGHGEGLFTLFVTDHGGEIYTTTGSVAGGWNPWSRVSDGRAAPGSPVTALAIHAPSLLPRGPFALFATDPTGRIRMTAGNATDGWAPWSSVSDGQATPGTPVTAASFRPGPFALFVTDPGGEIFTNSAHLLPPEQPTNLRVVNVAVGKIDVAWSDNSDSETGFRVEFRGRRAGESDHTGADSYSRDQQAASLTGLRRRHEYTISVVAFNEAGDSPRSNEVRATTPNAPETATVILEREIILEGPIPYLGRYPSGFGDVPPGRLLQIRLPQAGLVDTAVHIVRHGHSTEECGDPAAVVTLLEGQATTPQQLTDIYGVAQPPYSNASPIAFVACFTSPTLVDRLHLEITILPD